MHYAASNEKILSRFKAINYLQDGSPRQRHAYLALKGLGILETLRPYSAILAGTIPLGIELPESDLDIICQCEDVKIFEEFLINNFGNLPNFQSYKTSVRGQESVVARFQTLDFDFEVFGQTTLVDHQFAVVHMIIEERLLRLGAPGFESEIRKLKQSGIKTEPAFAQCLKLPGDPYEALYNLAKLTDQQLTQLILTNFR